MDYSATFEMVRFARGSVASLSWAKL